MIGCATAITWAAAIAVAGGSDTSGAVLYRKVPEWPILPESMNGGKWGEVPAVEVDRQGHVWIIHRCFGTEPRGGATCIGLDRFPPILQFDPSGKMLNHFGNGMFAFVHGSHIDADGNIWVTDASVEKGLPPDTLGGERGNRVLKFSSDGNLLMIIGRGGLGGDMPGGEFHGPTDVVTAPDRSIFITDGEGYPDGHHRVLKFSPDGKFIKSWGQKGTGPGEFNQPHTLAIDSTGRIFVGDRGNNRVQIFDQEGSFLGAWDQFGRPSGLTITPKDILAVTDSQSSSSNNPGRPRGIYVGSARTGTITGFIPDPDFGQQDRTFISGATGIAIGMDGAVYAGDIGPTGLRKYVVASGE